MVSLQYLMYLTQIFQHKKWGGEEIDEIGEDVERGEKERRENLRCASDHARMCHFGGRHACHLDQLTLSHLVECANISDKTLQDNRMELSKQK